MYNGFDSFASEPVCPRSYSEKLDWCFIRDFLMVKADGVFVW